MGTYADYKNRQQPTAKAGTASVGSYAQYKERHAKGRADRLSSFLGTDFTQYIQDYNAFVNAAAADSEKVTYGNAASSLQSRNSMAGTLRDRASKMEMYLEANRESLTDEQYQNALSALRSASKGVNTVMDYYGDRARYYGQWDTEEAYRAAMESAPAVDLTNSYDPSRNLQEGQAGWNDYVATQDRIAQNKMQTQEEKPLWEKLLGYLGDVQDTSLSVHTTQQVTKGYQEQEAAMQRPDDRWSDEQKYAFGYLWNQDRQSAYQYAYAVNNMLNKQQEQDQIQKIKELATKNLGAGAAHTVGAILSAPSGMADYLGDIIAQGALGYIPEADGQVSPFEYSQAVTGSISQNLNEKYGTIDERVPVLGGKGLGDVYGLGTSIAQSSLAAFSGGSGQALVQFFGSSAAAGVDDALSRGAEGNKAVAYGTMLGLAEGLAEMIGVDNLMKIGASDTLRQLVNNLLKQGAAEGIEEGVTAILNNFTDNLVMGNKSNFYALVKQFMANGMSEEEAKRHAWTALAEGVAFDMLGGFVSGAAHAAPQTAYQTYQQKQSGAGKNTATQQPRQSSSFIQDLADRVIPARKNTAAEAQQSAEKASQDYVNSLLDEATAKATGAPADPVGAAVEAFKTTGTVTDKQAADILGSVRAVSHLVEKQGFKMPKNTADRPAAVKQAIADLAQKQATSPVDTETKTDYDNKNTQGGIIDGTGTQSAQTLYRRGDTLTHEAQSRTRAETGDRSGIQSVLGETGTRFGSSVPVRQHHGLTSEAGDFSETDYIAPDVGSALHEVQNTFRDAGIECRVVKASSWGRENSAYSNNGIVYISEGIDPDTLATAFPHESTHIMKQDSFAPYLDFAERTPDMLDLRGANAAKLINLVAAHRKIDIFNMSQRQLTDLYDELNAIVYGMYKGGILDNSEFDYGAIVPGAFTDFEGYIQELESIHDQFRRRRKAPDESVGAAPSGFDPISHLQYEYGTIPEGENPVRPDDLPKSTDGKDRVSHTARTVKGAKVTPDEFVDLLDKEVAEGGLSYIPITNNATTQRAIDHISNVGWEEARKTWSADVYKGKAGADMSAVGALLLNNAAKAGDKAAWREILHDYQRMGTNTAQGLQALRILKKLEPMDRLYMIERSVKQMAEDMHVDVTLDDALLNEYENAKTDEARDKALDKIQQSVADQIPSTFMEKWTALRYVNMLGNLRTQVRNVAGNAGMKAVSSVRNAIAALVENAAHSISGGKIEKTKSLTVNKAQLEAGKADFDRFKSMVLGGGKYADAQTASGEFAQGVQDKRTIFKFKPLEGYRKVTGWAMEKGDVIFSRGAYARALAGYLKAHGVTETDLSKVDTTLMDKARLYAAQEAQEQTFRDTNWLSGWVSKIGRRKDTPAAGKLLSEGIMPFRKTPANVLIRAEEYSPLGVINSVYYSIKSAQNGSDVTASQVINSWAKTLTGSGIFALGMLLSNLGILSGGPDEDENKEAFESLNGWQNYALILPDGTNITIDWLTPAAMPLLMGAQLMELVQDGGFQLKDLEKALLSIADPMVEMSMLQGINDTLGNVRYANGNNLGQFAANAALSYLTQGLTNTLLGQIERTFEDSRMTTYADKDSALPDWLQRVIGKASAKTPGVDYNQIPYINAWGEEEKNPPTLLNGLYNTLSPGYIEKGVSDALTQELNRLNGAQSDRNVFPSTPDKTITIGGKKRNLSSDEYVALAKRQGQTARRIVEDMIASEYYGGLSDQQKAAAISYAYDYAREHARVETLEDYEAYSAKWMENLGDNAAETILRKVAVGSVEKYTDIPIDSAAYISDLLDRVMPETGYSGTRYVQRVETITGSDLTEDQQKQITDEVLDDAAYAKYLRILDEGYSNDDYAAALRIYLDSEKTSTRTKKEVIIREYMDDLDLSRKEAEALYKLYSGK